jgi:2-polyprenyl-3-methyl-5-hydroxy-6-metoxy-1,4-benzoquinol methylase
MTDDFHFDTEIIIKLFHQGFRIKEIPIPTYYGDELCYVDGMRYAKDVFRAVTRYKRTVRGIQSYPEFREFFPHYPVRKNQFSSHHWLKSLSGSGHQILDIGCGEGELAQELAEQNEVVGVDILSTPRNRGALKDYVQIDLENGSLADNEKLYGSKFDRILLPDVLEHLRNPERVLSDCQELLAPDGRILVSLPNVANITVRFSLLFGRWSYSDRGILDKTHVRFYTRKSGKRLIEGCGYRVVQTRTSIMPITMLLGLDERGAPAKLLSRSLNVVTRLLPGFMGYQLIYEAVRDEAL